MSGFLFVHSDITIRFMDIMSIKRIIRRFYVTIDGFRKLDLFVYMNDGIVLQIFHRCIISWRTVIERQLKYTFYLRM